MRTGCWNPVGQNVNLKIVPKNNPHFLLGLKLALAILLTMEMLDFYVFTLFSVLRRDPGTVTISTGVGSFVF